jgi:hypothetical protein
MATTTLALAPYNYSPVYGNLWFQLTSTSYALNNFKYVFDLKKLSLTGTPTSLGRYKVPPSVSGYGLYDASRVLQTQLTCDVLPNIVGVTASLNSNTGYRISYGFEYNPSRTFSSTFATASKLGLTFQSAHGLLAGDLIQISKDNKTINYEYDGTASVVNVSGLSVATDKNYILASTNESGMIISQLRIEGTSSNLNTFNGVRPYEDKLKNYGLTGSYLHDGTDLEFGSTYSMTNYSFINGTFPTYDGSKEVGLDDWETSSYLVDNFGGLIGWVGLQLYDANFLPLSSGNSYFTFSYTAGKNPKRVEVGVGPQNLSASLGISVNDLFSGSSASIDKAYYYMVCLQSPSLPTPGRPTQPILSVNSYGLRFFKIKDNDPLANCSPYPKTRLAFVNKLGGVDYFNFNFKMINTMTTEKTFFKRELPFNYVVGDRQDFVLSQKATETYTISSDFLTDKVSLWLKELLVSTEVYTVDKSGQKYPIIITDTAYQVKTKLNDKIYSVVITYKMAYQINTAQG